MLLLSPPALRTGDSCRLLLPSSLRNEPWGKDPDKHMWKLRKLTDGDHLVLSLSGRIEGQELFELQREVCSHETANQKIELDLESLRLVDQLAVSFLTCCELSGIQLRNCPSYIREWIEREKTKHNHQPAS